MKIIVPAIGSRGDVQPYIALCQGLQQAGHQVILATNPTLVKIVESYGVHCEPVGPSVDMGAEGARIWEKSGKNWMLGFMRTMQFGMRLLEQAYPDIYPLCQKADLVIATDISAGIAEADVLGIPWINVTLQPDRIPVPNPKASWFTRMGFSLAGNFANRPMNRLRKRVGAPPLSGGMAATMSPRLTLVPVSPAVAKANSNWPPQVHLTGYWTAQSPEAWTPPQDLLEFLSKGEKPIAVSLGAMSFSGESARQAALITLEAVQKAGVRAIVQGWEEQLKDVLLPESIYHAGSLPHTWLFEQVRAVIHHGGFGTTASGLTAGIPAVIIPHIIDQYAWGQRVFDLGAGPKFIPRYDLSVEKLTLAISTAVNNPDIQMKAHQLGQQIRTEPDGIQQAVQWIEKTFAK